MFELWSTKFEEIIQSVPLATEPGISLLINTNKDIATRFEQQYVRCVRNEEECVCSVCLFRCNIFIGVRIIKEMPGSVASGTPYTKKSSSYFTVNTTPPSRRLTN